MATSKTQKHRRASSGTVAAYSIADFCEAHGISIGLYYALRRRKQAPQEMRVGRRWLISQEAAAEWRRAREQG